LLGGLLLICIRRCWLSSFQRMDTVSASDPQFEKLAAMALAVPVGPPHLQALHCVRVACAWSPGETGARRVLSNLLPDAPSPKPEHGHRRASRVVLQIIQEREGSRRCKTPWQSRYPRQERVPGRDEP
jgi:hypothetical protein